MKKNAARDSYTAEFKREWRSDCLFFLNEMFVTEILSIPTISSHMITLLENVYLGSERFELVDLDFKTLFHSYNFLKKTREHDLIQLDEEETSENQMEQKGSVLREQKKNINKMVIFSNVFELLNRFFISQKNGTMEILGPVLTVLD